MKSGTYFLFIFKQIESIPILCRCKMNSTDWHMITFMQLTYYHSKKWIKMKWISSNRCIHQIVCSLVHNHISLHRKHRNIVKISACSIRWKIFQLFVIFFSSNCIFGLGWFATVVIVTNSTYFLRYSFHIWNNRGYRISRLIIWIFRTVCTLFHSVEKPESFPSLLHSEIKAKWVW